MKRAPDFSFAALFVLFLALTGFGSLATAQAQEARLLRFPTIHGNQIVFTYAGDLYTVSATGGMARRLTSDIGFESFARFSPDGSSIAFTGQYDGNTEVYLMPAQGGVPKRLTWTATLARDDVSDRMGPNNMVIGWKDDTHVLFRSRRTDWNDFLGKLYLANVNGGPIQEIPLPRGGFGSYSPDGSQLVYNRIFREFRTWKRYRGGMADDVWLYDFASRTTTNLTDHPAQDIIPMWTEDAVYYLSDREPSYRMNLYRYDFQTKETAQLTDFTDFDIKFPSLGDEAIVFEKGGYIYRFDLATEEAVRVPVTMAEDFDGSRPSVVDVSGSVTNYEIAPDGSRAIFGARGDVFTVPESHGPTRNLTRTPGIHERNAKWSPDGRWISYVSDTTGEDEIWMAPQDGLGEAVQLTTGSRNYKYQPLWSPDSKKLLWSDRMQRLRFVDVDSREITDVADAEAWEITDYTWSPDSRWIAYVKPEDEGQGRLFLYSLESRETIPATDGWFPVSSPAFSPDGKLLFFVSGRTFNPTYGQLEFEHIYTDMSRVYFLALAKDTPNPFAPRSDEVTIQGEEAAAAEAPDEPGPQGGPSVRVDADGLIQRIGVLPVPAANYRGLATTGSRIFYSRGGVRADPGIYVFDLDTRKETQVFDGNAGFEISVDGKKMLLGTRGRYAIVNTPSGSVSPSEYLDLSDLKVTVDRHAEWQQIFQESWRQMRDFFWNPEMNGVDWPAMRDRYAPLVPHVNHRADLTYVIGEMISELNVGHTYVGGGDLPELDRIPMGLLGARLERDPDTHFFRIAKILKGQNWDPGLRSPLTEIGVDVNEGEYIVAVDGRSTAEMTDIWEALAGKADKQVTLSVNASPSTSGARTTVAVPIQDERGLYYFNWVQDNIQKVSEATDGQVGYLHIPDMGVPGLNEFAKYYYPQVNKKALIIDVRSNGGGNVSPMITARLNRELVMVDKARNATPGADPGAMVVGPKVLLADEFSASDGDLMTWRFKANQIGPVIGKRTWGGVVGIRGSLPFLDGGVLNKPEFSRYDIAGRSWIIEGVGVEPDIYVDNDPALEYAGEDQQLDKAIEVIQELLKQNPGDLASPPPYPIKRGGSGGG